MSASEKKNISSPRKKTTAKPSAPKKKVSTSKKTLTEKEKLQKEANRLLNSSPKKKPGKRPVKAVSKQEAANLLDAIVYGLQEKKAKNITLLNLSKIQNRVCDYFILADAESTTHVSAIAGSVDEWVRKKTGEKPYHTEGYENALWILIDYVNIVVHIFQQEAREYYNIEGLWADAEIKTINS